MMAVEPARALPASRRPMVFIVRDHTMEELLDRLAAQLRGRGIEVARGPANTPGVVVPTPAGVGLEHADIAVFSSRWQCTRQTLAQAVRLRAVVNATIGLETVDLQAAADLGIIVGHGGAPEHITSMAEASIMLMLNLLYGLRRSESWMSGWRPRPYDGKAHASMMCGATIGLVGLGRIGRAVMERLQAFGARIVAYSPRADRSQIPDGVRLTDLDTVMRESDLVGVFVAVRPDNRGLIGARQIALMKPTAYLVNVARGDALDEEALARALRAGEIAGAALDTFAVEPLPQDSPLRGLPNVILTPHVVGHTRQSMDSVLRVAVDNITSVLRGDLPTVCKNPEIEPAWRGRLAALA
ncbi:NAD(P)-dependent oxidoreductase [Pigmentiphaga sp. YJ18]|uniref:NAD(P)-dependent oxidoreductase n=1 Tax=Pigmentiphaga sp. YJ18 TaxID=3134907 RepID=UPI00310E1830